MYSKILLITVQRVDQEGFLELIDGLGGERSSVPWMDAYIRRGDAQVWVTVDPEMVPELEPEDWLRYEEKLGIGANGIVQLEVSPGIAADAIAMEIIESAAQKWQFVVDDDHDGLHTLEELRSYQDEWLPFGGKNPRRRH